jgi:hypothetical protein
MIHLTGRDYEMKLVTGDQVEFLTDEDMVNDSIGSIT